MLSVEEAISNHTVCTMNDTICHYNGLIDNVAILLSNKGIRLHYFENSY